MEMVLLGPSNRGRITGRLPLLDDVRIGVPLNLPFWVLASLQVPRIWPF